MRQTLKEKCDAQSRELDMLRHNERIRRVDQARIIEANASVALNKALGQEKADAIRHYFQARFNFEKELGS